MFRSLRHGRSILSMSRIPLRLQAQNQHGQVGEVQRVQFRKTPFGFRVVRTTIVNLFVIYGAYWLYGRLVMGPLDKLDPADFPEEEEDDGPLFIPLLGTTKQLKPVPYRGSDPEWQEFIKFSKDAKQSQKVREELASLVCKAACQNPFLQLKFGKEMKLRRFWLDVDFPSSAPPEFERTGIEFTDDDWPRLTTQKVDSFTVFRIRSALWPSAYGQSTWSFAKTLGKEEFGRFKRMLGYPADPAPPSFEQMLSQHQQLIKKPRVPSPDGPPTQPSIIGGRPKPADNGPNSEQSALTGKGDEQLHPATKIVMSFRGYFLAPMLAFRQKYSQTRKAITNLPPRGSILVSGLVEIDSPKAWMVFDVIAHYNPKSNSFDTRSLKLVLRRLQAKKQVPAGRPPLPPPPSVP